MAQLTEDEILARVKTQLGIMDNYSDAILSEYIAEAESFMTGAGITKAKALSREGVGLITRLVIDTWNNGSGSVKLSEYTKTRLVQLALSPSEEETA